MSPPSTAAGAALAPSRVPSAIGGFETVVGAYDLGPFSVGLVSVRDLEKHLDRDRLLHDETVEPPYWALVWSGSRILAEHIASRMDCEGRSALEVGCGLGLVSLAAARRGARVTAIDRELTPIEFLIASAAANRLRLECLVADPTRADLGRRFDFVFAAELLYERALFPSLARALTACVAPGGELWIADAQRVDTTSFYEELSRLGFATREVCVCDCREESSVVRVRLVSLGRTSAVASLRSR